MKKQKLIFYCFVWFNVTALLATNNSKNIFTDSTIWRMDAYAGFQSENAYYYFHNYFNGDTLIKGSIYKKIRKALLIEGNNPYLMYWLVDSGYMGAFRFDTLVSQ